MANVLHHPIEFQPRPVSHAPSPFGFGFGLGASSSTATAGWQPITTPGHTNPAAFQQLASSVNHCTNIRPQKRRIELEDDVETSRQSGLRDDASMDRSPTPERPKRAAPKRARVTPHLEGSFKGNSTEYKENKAPDAPDDQDVDIGVLLASLPSQSLLPILMSLLHSQPSLKPIILPLIPRPTLETAAQALSQSAKKLRDAYPYSSGPAFTHTAQSTTSFGLVGKSQSNNVSAFGHTPNSNNGGMRDSYITSRLRPHVTEFVAACFSYLPYFSLSPASSRSGTTSQIGLQSLHKDKSHPSETFQFLLAVTNHIMAQPALAQSQLLEHLLPRLSEEWKAWVLKVDDIVNRQGGMFGSETVRGWERALDEMADGKGSEVMGNVRDLWVSKVGWLIGRTASQQMDE